MADTLLKVLISLLVLLTAIYPLNADAPPSQQFPTSGWETCAGVIEFSSAIVTIAGKDKQESKIKIYIRNISTTAQALVVSSETDQGFSVFSIDTNGGNHLLHDRTVIRRKMATPQEQLQEEERVALASRGSVQEEQIDPGETKSWDIGITSADLAIIKSRPLQFNFIIVHRSTGKSQNVKSSPKLLTQTVIASPSPK